MSHLRLWQFAWSLVAVAGVGLAMLEWPWLVVVLALGLLVGLGWFLKLMVFVGKEADLPWPARLCQRTVSRPLALATGLVAVSAIGSVSVQLALVLVLAAVLTAPRAVRTLRRPVCRRRADTSAEPVTRGVDLGDYSRLTLHQPPSPLEGLDDRQLCRLWRESFWDLGSPSPAPTLLRVVLIREACLDELERRDAAALRAWLDSGARASGGPEKFMGREGRGGTEAA